MVDLGDEELEINYPTRWEYTVIVLQDADSDAIIAEIFQDIDYTVQPSRISSSGKYVSVKVHAMVYSDDDRLANFAALRDHELVRFVI